MKPDTKMISELVEQYLANIPTRDADQCAAAMLVYETAVIKIANGLIAVGLRPARKADYYEALCRATLKLVIGLTEEEVAGTSDHLAREMERNRVGR